MGYIKLHKNEVCKFARYKFADVDVFVTAKGGVDGAEGGVSLLVCGSKVEVQKVEAVVRQVSGEPDFLKK